jgi:hypothetical protein
MDQLMKKLCYFLFSFVLVFLSCQQDVDVDKLVAEYAKIQCRAIVLKDKRYELADHLRNIEVDSINKKREIDSLLVVIAEIKNHSLMLADSIKVKLDDILTNKLSSRSAQKEFTNRLATYIKAQGCSFQQTGLGSDVKN